MRNGIGDGNRVQGLTTCSLGTPNLDFQPILSTSKFYSKATWHPWHCSTKIWMSTELAENQDLGPLGYPHHRGVLGFCRTFHANLKIAQGLRVLPCLLSWSHSTQTAHEDQGSKHTQWPKWPSFMPRCDFAIMFTYSA